MPSFIVKDIYFVQPFTDLLAAVFHNGNYVFSLKGLKWPILVEN